MSNCIILDDEEMHDGEPDETATLAIDWSAWPGLKPADVELLVGLDQEEANGRWCAVGAYLHLLGEQSGRLRLRAGDQVTEHIAAVRKRRKDRMGSYLRRWPGLTQGQAQVLNLVDMCEERGDWHGVRTLLEESLGQVVHPEAIKHVNHIRQRLLNADTRETEDGPRSLIRKEHPWFQLVAYIKDRHPGK